MNKPCPSPWVVHSAGEIRCYTNACSSRPYPMSVIKKQKETWESFTEEADFQLDLKAWAGFGELEMGVGS